MRRGVALVELLVMLGWVGVLGGILVPSLAYLDARANEVICLANLGRLAAASHAYALDDAGARLVPVHRNDVRMDHGMGFGGTWWGWHTALPRAFGGATPTLPMPAEIGYIMIITVDGAWGNRPLNPYVSQSIADVFHCPADLGLPAYQIEDLADLEVPLETEGMSCFSYLGNSYRITGLGLNWVAGAAIQEARLSTAPAVHSAWAIEHPTATVLYCEPIFSWTARLLSEGHDVSAAGWHGAVNAGNVAYCDGSARHTPVGELYQFGEEELEEMNFSPDYSDNWQVFLRRGTGWRQDVYPTPGAVTRIFLNDLPLWDPEELAGLTGWPFDGFTLEEPPR